MVVVVVEQAGSGLNGSRHDVDARHAADNATTSRNTGVSISNQEENDGDNVQQAITERMQCKVKWCVLLCSRQLTCENTQISDCHNTQTSLDNKIKKQKKQVQGSGHGASRLVDTISNGQGTKEEESESQRHRRRRIGHNTVTCDKGADL